jgi:hypothetical protein
MALYQYNPLRIAGSFVGTAKGRPFAVQFVGVMDGTFYSAEYDEARVTKHAGGQGDHSFVMNASKGAKLKGTFVQGSPTNDDLSDLIPDAERNYMPVGVLHLEDLNGSTVFISHEAVISTVAKVEFGKDLIGREWEWECGKTEIFVGGAEDE